MTVPAVIVVSDDVSSEVATAEAPADAAAAVEIAQIEADRDVAVAEIGAGVAEAAIEAAAEAEDQEAEEWLQGELAGLRSECANLAERLAALETGFLATQEWIAVQTALTASQTPQLPLETQEPTTEPTLPQEAPAEEIPSEGAPDPAAAESPPPAPKHQKRRWL